MWAEVHGERKKVACGPCIRGHRSSKCDHRDRVLVEVRKPGRPLSSCPHPSGSCSCERVVINYTIPKTSECACPSEHAPPTATVAGNSRIQKNRRRSTAINASSLEKAIRAGLDAETDTSSITHTPSETSNSNAASLPSSASSTPRLLPAQNENIASCCKPKPIQQPTQQGGCCSGKAVPPPEPVVKKSCCSSSKNQPQPPLNSQPNMYQQLGQQFQFAASPQIQSQYPSFQSHAPSPASTPFGLGAPIYNHAAAAYQQPISMPMSPTMAGPMPPHVSHPQVGQHAPEHNCHCGETCSCFGCAAHPNNATMMEYVRLMAEFQYSGGFGTMGPPLYDMPTYPHHPGFGAESAHSVAFNSLSQGLTTPTPTQMSFQASVNMLSMATRPETAPGSWQQSTFSSTMPQSSYTNPLNFSMSSAAQDPGPLKMEESVGTPAADSPNDDKEGETPTLSPSSYFWNQMTLPGCSDATGTCQCGDGCACVGCLTHGGHTGVPLNTAANTDHNAFTDYPNDADLGLDHDNDFMSFNPGLT